MSNTSLSNRAVSLPVLPEFAARRVEHFHNTRVKVDWGGRHILRGRIPTPSDLLLQSNDYLAVACHPDIIQAQRQTLADDGQGMMMSALFMQQNDDPLHRVERELAGFLGYEDGILSQSGYNANVGLIQAIAGERIPVYIDVLAHASLWEGIRSAGARAVPILHNEVVHLERQVLRNGPGVIVVDAIYSTNGSLAPLREIASVGARHDCVVIVDESHSLGTHGAHGEGLVASLGLNDRVHFITASLAKAYCTRAGFIACGSRFKDYFGCESRPAIFSTSLLPHELSGLAATHRVIRAVDDRRDRLRRVTRRVRNALLALGYPVADGSEQIVALEAGAELLTARVRDELEAHGIFGSVFSAPATTLNRSLLRLTLNAGLSDADIEKLLAAFAAVRDRIELADWSASRRQQRSRAELVLECIG